MTTHKTATTDVGATIDIDGLISDHMAYAVDAMDRHAPLLPGMGRYHLGWVDRHFQPLPSGQVDQGKRIRPLIAMLCCAAAGGDLATAAPLGAALELLHNFTLVHDDIQDHSPTRRHRATVWTLWGTAQAINAGDALFASAHLALYRLRQHNIAAELVMDLAEAFDRMTIDIVAGQVLDLSFEQRSNVAPSEYLQMIAGKTAAIVKYAAWAGALLGGATLETAERFGDFGLSLGLGFQVQDDLLGVWGTTVQTGKAAADDIRRKKQSLPLLLLRAAADDAARAELDDLYRAVEIGPDGIARVLALLERFEIRSDVERHVRAYHDDAIGALEAACPDPTNVAKLALLARVESLASRSH